MTHPFVLTLFAFTCFQLVCLENLIEDHQLSIELTDVVTGNSRICMLDSTDLINTTRNSEVVHTAIFEYIDQNCQSQFDFPNSLKFLYALLDPNMTIVAVSKDKTALEEQKRKLEGTSETYFFDVVVLAPEDLTQYTAQTFVGEDIGELSNKSVSESLAKICIFYILGGGILHALKSNFENAAVKRIYTAYVSLVCYLALFTGKSLFYVWCFMVTLWETVPGKKTHID